MEVKAAYAACARLARRHYENFPVASRLLPEAMRPHVAAIYAFARVADDFADEGDRAAADRLARLDGWLERLHACAAHEGGGQWPPEGGEPAEAPLIFQALGATVGDCQLPVALLDDLLSAFCQDVTVSRYATWADLLDYCRRSANPVGRLVLRIAGYHAAGLDEASDCLCTALQLTNFWQDLKRDWRRGRLYVPLADVEASGARLGDLDGRALTPAWRSALGCVAARTRSLFREGRAVCDGVGGRLRLELRLTWLGGHRILDRLEKVAFDVFASRPALGLRDAPLLLWQAFRWRSRTVVTSNER
jgi:squalene synthase HpnC